MEMTKEIMYDQFKTLKSNNEKVKYLVDLKELKQKTPHVFRNIKISIKQFNNLIIRVSNPLVQCIERLPREKTLKKEKKLK